MYPYVYPYVCILYIYIYIYIYTYIYIASPEAAASWHASHRRLGGAHFLGQSRHWPLPPELGVPHARPLSSLDTYRCRPQAGPSAGLADFMFYSNEYIYIYIYIYIIYLFIYIYI